MSGNFIIISATLFLLIFHDPTVILLVSGELSKAEVESELNLLAVGRMDITKHRIQMILQAMDTRPILNQLVRNEIYLRRLYTQKLDDSCVFKENEKIESPPVKLVDYMAWQRKFIDAKKNLCDPLHHLRCNKASTKCTCVNNLNLLPAGNITGGRQCQLLVSVTCGEFLPLKLFYDPLSLKDEDDMNNNSLSAKGKFPKCDTVNSGKCAKLDYFIKSFCLYNNFLDPPAEPKFTSHQELSTTASNLAKLGVDESCNLQLETNLFHSKDPDYPLDYRANVKQLEAIKIDGNALCDIKKLLYCSENSQCKCLEPTVLNPNTKKCEILPWQNCGIKWSREEVKKFIIDKSIGSIVSDGLAEGLRITLCDNKTFCTPDSDISNVCACKFGKIGLNCEESGSTFLVNAQPIFYPSDEEIFLERLKIFSNLTQNMLKLEQLMVLSDKSDSKCDLDNEAKVDKAILFTHKISPSSRSEPDPELFKSSYEAVINLVVAVIKTGKPLCNRHDKVTCKLGICENSEIKGSSMPVFPTLPSSRLLTPPEEVKMLQEKIMKLFILESGQPCKMNVYASDSSLMKILEHLRNLVKMNEELCDGNKGLDCVDGICKPGSSLMEHIQSLKQVIEPTFTLNSGQLCTYNVSSSDKSNIGMLHHFQLLIAVNTKFCNPTKLLTCSNEKCRCGDEAPILFNGKCVANTMNKNDEENGSPKTLENLGFLSMILIINLILK